MLSLESLRKIRDGLQADVTGAQQRLATLDADIQKVKDAHLEPKFATEQVEALRKAATDELARTVGTVDERIARAVAAKRFWSNKALLLQQQKFADDPAADAVIRLRWNAELAHVGAVLLAEIAANAKDEGSLPVLWQCVLAADAPPNKAPNGSAVALALDDVTIPQQAQALQAIEDCQNLAWLAHGAYAAASGTPLTGATKLTAARAAQSLQRAA